MNIQNIKRKLKLNFTSITAALIGLVVVGGSFYTVNQGDVGIVLRFSKSIDQVDPGLHFKFPFIDSVKYIEVRERRNVEELQASTGNQLPITAVVSINWTVKTEEARKLYDLYGGLAQFEFRILDPKLRQAAKAGLAKFTAAELIRDRNKAVGAIMENMQRLMAPYPVAINSPQVENVGLPKTYLQSILAKEKAREEAVREEHNLRKQKLTAQQAVQTATATAESAKKIADGKAYALTTVAVAEAAATQVKGDAEAEVISKVQSAIASNPLIIAYERAKRWNGKLPTTVMGGSADIPIIFSVNPKK